MSSDPRRRVALTAPRGRPPAALTRQPQAPRARFAAAQRSPETEETDGRPDA